MHAFKLQIVELVSIVLKISDKAIKKEKTCLNLSEFSLELYDPLEHKDITSFAKASVIFLNRLFARFV